MNRREFCQTAALFLTGSAFAGTSLPSDESAIRFRAQKIFLESRENIRHGDCNAVLLISGGRSGADMRMTTAASEANRLGLRVFMPTSLSREFLEKTRRTVFLSDESGILQSVNRKTAGSGGLLLLDGTNNAFGLVLYDSSQCLWTGFAVPNVDRKQHTGNDSRLIAARWIDRTLSHCSESLS
ncbi:MAG: hypothetical protein LBI05_00015 [Planctomycetaceae bacterium]|jgi:hypothetical protein|nr:hypothetical protein [Planctomycetaceae bacterium]